MVQTEASCSETEVMKYCDKSEYSNSVQKEISDLRADSWNHRITEWLGLEGTSRIIKLQPPCCMQGYQPPHLILDQAAQGPSLVLNTSRNGASTASLGSLFQHLTTLRVTNVPLISCPCFNSAETLCQLIVPCKNVL